MSVDASTCSTVSTASMSSSCCCGAMGWSGGKDDGVVNGREKAVAEVALQIIATAWGGYDGSTLGGLG